MLRLIAVNALAGTLFAGLYGLAGARLIPQALFVASLLPLLMAMVVFWLYAEARHAVLEPMARVGRAGFALAMVLLVGPTVVLLPVFGLETILPADAHDVLHRGPVMALLLIGAVWVTLVNVIGAVVVGARAVGRWGRRRRPA